MRWTRGDVQVLMADLLVVLIPVTLLFATLGLQGWRLAGVEIRLYQFLLLISVPFALVQSGLGPLRDAWRAPGIPAIGLSLLLSVFSTAFVKEMPTLEASEVKNTIIPMILSFFVILGFATSYRRIRWLLLAAMFGIAISVTIVSSGLLSISFGVRPISQLDLFESFGLTYVWLGVGSATVLGISSWFAFGHGARPTARFAFIGVSVIALSTLLASGTRAAIMAAVIAPCLVFGSTRIPWWILRSTILTVMIVLTGASLYPDLPLRFLGSSEMILPVGVEGAERLTKSEAYQGDFSSRLVWWKLMQDDHSMTGAFFGFDYGRALLRTGVLGHPHNVLVWARIMAGLPAALALAFGLTRAFVAAVHRLRTTSYELRSLAALEVFCMCLLVPVLLTNSWPGGTLLVFAFAMALSAFLSRAVRESATLASPAYPPSTPAAIGARAASWS